MTPSAVAVFRSEPANHTALSRVGTPKMNAWPMAAMVCPICIDHHAARRVALRGGQDPSSAKLHTASQMNADGAAPRTRSHWPRAFNTAPQNTHGRRPYLSKHELSGAYNATMTARTSDVYALVQQPGRDKHKRHVCQHVHQAQRVHRKRGHTKVFLRHISDGGERDPRGGVG